MEKKGKSKYEERSIEVFLKNYKVGKILGVGSTAKVKAAIHKLTGHQVAIKILNHHKIAKMGLEHKGPFSFLLIFFLFSFIPYILYIP